ncbi:hypothetical protein [Aureibacter tunicatorum]|uniref:Uncharacterized protein n=1 Tax=Aureibacter tunicatorum TaxID=866807 RepID=A0AAE4BR09_9BACT|nr:hypothetical protein [Aureibacter tunicatorum]MDR6237448.1 hypothetical protein [Aureibacter tunicatorum]BDD06438.1 hypothetical protein AUTU_39210 [Aureibacter tunicatorum]
MKNRILYLLLIICFFSCKGEKDKPHKERKFPSFLEGVDRVSLNEIIKQPNYSDYNIDHALEDSLLKKLFQFPLKDNRWYEFPIDRDFYSTSFRNFTATESTTASQYEGEYTVNYYPTYLQSYTMVNDSVYLIAMVYDDGDYAWSSALTSYIPKKGIISEVVYSIGGVVGDNKLNIIELSENTFVVTRDLNGFANWQGNSSLTFKINPDGVFEIIDYQEDFTLDGKKVDRSWSEEMMDNQLF